MMTTSVSNDSESRAAPPGGAGRGAWLVAGAILWVIVGGLVSLIVRSRRADRDVPAQASTPDLRPIAENEFDDWRRPRRKIVAQPVDASELPASTWDPAGIADFELTERSGRA